MMLQVTRDDQELTGLEVIFPALDHHVPVPADTQHQVILVGAVLAAPVVVPGLRKPTDVGWIKRANQWMLGCAAKNRPWNDVHVLAGKSFSHTWLRHTVRISISLRQSPFCPLVYRDYHGENITMVSSQARRHTPAMGTMTA